MLLLLQLLRPCCCSHVPGQSRPADAAPAFAAIFAPTLPAGLITFPGTPLSLRYCSPMGVIMAVLGLLRLLLPLLLILLLYSPVRCAPCCCSDGPDHFLKPSAATKRGGGLSLGLVRLLLWLLPLYADLASSSLLLRSLATVVASLAAAADHIHVDTHPSHQPAAVAAAAVC